MPLTAMGRLEALLEAGTGFGFLALIIVDHRKKGPVHHNGQTTRTEPAMLDESKKNLCENRFPREIKRSPQNLYSCQASQAYAIIEALKKMRA